MAVTQLSSCRHSLASSSLSPAQRFLLGFRTIDCEVVDWKFSQHEPAICAPGTGMALILHDPPWNHLAGVCRCRDLADLPPWNTQLCARSPSLPTQLTLARFCLATGRRFVPAHRFHLSSYIFSRTLPWSQNDAQRR